MNKTILVVDYEQKSLDEIQELFRDEEFDLLTAVDGSEALEIFEKKTPDLVLTSALLPKLNGFELCKKIVSGQHGEVCPVIMFSGIYKAEKYRKEAIIACGAVDFLEKPLAKGQLLKVIKGLFSQIPGGPPVGPLELESPPLPPAFSTKSGSQSARLALSDDLLDVESLFSPATQPGHRDSSRNEIEVPVLLETDLPEPRVLSMSPLEQELDAAVDSVRTDLDSAPRLRDQQLVEEIEADLFKEGSNILEFESPAGTQPARTVRDDEAMKEIIELEEPAGTDTSSKPDQTQPATAAQPESDVGATPQFTLGTQQPRNWLPFIAIFLVGLLIVLVLWLRS